MKLIQRILSVLLAFATLAHTKDEPATATPTTARILGEIPDGSPPTPQPPKPEFHVAERDILSTTTHQQGGRTITIRRIKPINLTPPPAPVELNPTAADAEYSQRAEEFSEAHSKWRLLFIGATVFRSKDSPPRTLVRYWPGDGNPAITFWSSADFAIIAGGINSFVDAAGDTHSLIMGWGNVDIERMTDLLAAKGQEYDTPEMPVFTEGKATFQVVGDAPAAGELVAIQSLHDLYNDEYQRLKTAHEGRERARIEREEYLKAHPPQPKDITLNYWRVSKPAAKLDRGDK
jgi:hypothetical protein